MEAQVMISELEYSTIKVILFNVILSCAFRNQLYFILWEHLVTQATKTISLWYNCCSITYLQFQQDEINSPTIEQLDLNFLIKTLAWNGNPSLD